MKKVPHQILFIVMLIVSACAPNPNEPVGSEPSYPNASYPNPSPAPVAQNGYAPQPSDINLIQGKAFVSTKELLTLESFPLQFVLHLTGDLPTPCQQLRVAVSAPDTTNRINVDVYSVSEPDKICSQVIEPFDVSVPLGSFSPGTYTLWVNSEMLAEFQP